MRAIDIIIKKRDKQELTKKEIEYFVHGLTIGEIPDYQVAAWAMAVLLNGMTPRETSDLTMAMAYSGEVLDLSNTIQIVIDKHSTGGVGDKTTLVVEPIVAACGLPIGKMSGRGLGFSGGTLDKMESIPGYRTNLSKEEFLHQLATTGLVLTGQSSELAPADGKLYALRDVTGTVQSIPLIASSIMSKKIAGGAQSIVLDVKIGSGAFMKTEDEARQLADLMVSIGEANNRHVVAVLSNMDQPLGKAVGNALELREAIDVLHGGGPADLRAHCLALSAYMLVLGKKAPDLRTGRELAEKVIINNEAWLCFRNLVIAQGGDVSFIDHPEKLPVAQFNFTLRAQMDGWIKKLDAGLIGEATVLLGAGREKMGDPIDPAVGIIVEAKVGDRVKEGQSILTIYANSEEALLEGKQKALNAIAVQDLPVEPLPLFYGIISRILFV
jgi:pyrimidine-nucleoside phosphorylase